MVLTVFAFVDNPKCRIEGKAFLPLPTLLGHHHRIVDRLLQGTERGGGIWKSIPLYEDSPPNQPLSETYKLVFLGHF